MQQSLRLCPYRVERRVELRDLPFKKCGDFLLGDDLPDAK